jgi:hypothetical protein
VISGRKYGASIGFFEKDLFDYFVKDDTLFIQKKPGDSHMQIVSGTPLTIFSGPLKGVIAGTGATAIEGQMSDSFVLTASNNTRVAFLHLQTKKLSINANRTSDVSIMQSDTIPMLLLRLQGRSFLYCE